MNSLKSIYSRITSIQPAIDAMADIGINVKNSAGEMRDVSDILDDLGGKWSTLSAEQQQNLGLQIAGRFQLSRFLILMEQYDEALESTNTALNSTGSGYRENAEYMKSFEAQINQVKNAWTEAIISMKDSGFGDALVIGLQAGLEFFKVLTSIIDTIGVFPASLMAGTVALTAFGGKSREVALSLNKIPEALIKIVKESRKVQASTVPLNAMSDAAFKSATGFKQMSASTIATSNSVRMLSASNAAAATTTSTLSAVATTAGVAIRGMGAAIASIAWPLAIMFAVGSAISWITGKIAEHNQEQKELNRTVQENMQKNVAAVTTNSEEVEKLTGKYKKLSREREEASESEWDVEKEREYLQVTQELAQVFPGLVQEIDAKGNAHLKSADAIDEEIEKARELALIESGRILGEERDTYKEDLKDLRKYEDQVKLAESRIANYQRVAENGITEERRRKAQEKVAIYEAEKAHYEAVVAGIVSSAQHSMREVSDAYMLTKDVSGEVVAETQRAFNSLDLSSLSRNEISEARLMLDSFAVARQKAFDAEDVDKFNKETSKMINYLTKNLGISRAEVLEFAKDYEDTVDAVERGANAKDIAAQMTDEYGNSMDDAARSAEGLGDEINALTDSISFINGFLEEYNEHQEISTEKMLDILDKYPELIAYINDEAMFIEELTNIRDNDIDAAQQQMVEKLMISSEYYNGNLEMIQDFVKQQFGFYKGDLKEFNNLAQAKADVETQLINELSKKWAVYYDEVTKTFGAILQANKNSFYNPMSEADQKVAQQNALAISQMEEANRKLKASRDAWNQFSVGEIELNFKRLGTSADKMGRSAGRAAKGAKKASRANKGTSKSAKEATRSQKDFEKALEESIYVADIYKKALQSLNLELDKIGKLKSQYPTWSNNYRKSLQKEIDALKEKEKLLKREQEAMRKQVKSGNVQKTGVVTTSSSVSRGSTPQSAVWNFFKSKGLSDSAVAGIMGNIQQESGFNPRAVNRSSGASGIFQWLGSRKRELQNYANRVGKSWDDLQVQLEFAWQELNSSEKRSLESLKKGLTASQHASEFDRLFERSGRSQVAKRQSYANNFHSQFSGRGQNQVTTSSNKTAGYYLGGGFRVSSGFGPRNINVPGASRNHQGTDFAAPRGTPIKSVRAGEVVANYHQAQRGHVIQVKQDDGTYALYQHMNQKSGMKVGQKVSAGQVIGQVGSSGNSSGPHLHLEIKQNGKNIDPLPYLEAQAKMASEASKVVAQTQQDIDGLQSDIVSRESDIIKNREQIEALQRSIIESHMQEFDKRRVNYDNSIAHITERLHQLDTTTGHYQFALERQGKFLEHKQTVNQEELKFLGEMIRSGKYSAAVTSEMRDRMNALNVEMQALNNELQILSTMQIDAFMTRFTTKIEHFNYTIEKSRLFMERFQEGTAEWIAESERQAEVLEMVQTQTSAQIRNLQKLLLEKSLNPEDLKRYKEELRELSLEYLRVGNQIAEIEKSIADSTKNTLEKLAEDLVEAYKGVLQERRDAHIKSIDEEMKAEEKRHRTIMDNYRKEMDGYREIIQQKLDAIDKEESERDYNKEIEKLQEDRLEILKDLNLLSMDDSYEAKAERKKLQEELAEIDETIAERQHRREVDLRKENLQDMLTDKEKEISEKEKAETERFEKVTERIDKEREYWNQHYEDLLNDERKFAKIREDIMSENFDEIEGEFKDMLDEMKDTLPDLENTLDGTMEAVGTSIRQNLIDNLKEAIDLMGKVQDPSFGTSQGSGGEGGTGNAPSVDWGGTQDSTSVREHDEADMKVLAGKFIVDKMIAQETNRFRKESIRQRGYRIAEEGRSEGSTIDSVIRFDELVKSMSSADLRALADYMEKNVTGMFYTPEHIEYIRNYARRIDLAGQGFEKGGWTGKGGIGVLHEEEFVLNKGQTKEALKIASLFDRLSALSSIKSPDIPKIANQSALENIKYEINFNVDKMTGNEQDVDKFTKMFTDKLKRSKGVR